MTGDDELDQLYAGTPEAFTALRAELVAAAKKRGDKEAAERIGAARRPTTAAWVANSVVRADVTARPRLEELAGGLRIAHASMDGRRIRELSAAQRSLIDELVRTGFAATGLSQPSAALRDDVVGTLQAAVADPDVAVRLGRLAKAERWSGFGEFGAVSVVGTNATGKPRPADAPDPSVESRPTADEVASATRRVADARHDVGIAETAHVAAVSLVAERRARVATAHRRYEKLLEALNAAERELNTADAEQAAAEEAADGSAQRVEAARSLLSEIESELDAISGSPPTPITARSPRGPRRSR